MKKFLILLVIFLAALGAYLYSHKTVTAPIVISVENSVIEDIAPNIKVLSEAEKIQARAEDSYPKFTFETWIYVSASDEKLYLIKDKKIIKTYPISIAKSGVGNLAGSNKTPLGLHEIKKKIGAGIPQNGILKARAYTGEQAKIISEPISVNTDLVTSRILWLSGLELGYNLGGNVDSYNRFIYIHGTPEEGLIGQPASHGCIRMYNKDVIELFDLVPAGTKVLIEK
jgi:hypothetical protein